MRQPYDEIDYEELNVGGVLVRDRESELERVARGLYWDLKDFTLVCLDTIGSPYVIPEVVEDYKKVRKVQSKTKQRIRRPMIEKLGMAVGMLTYPIQVSTAIYSLDEGVLGLVIPLMFVLGNSYSFVAARRGSAITI